MKLEITGQDRLGITQEVLAGLAAERLDLAAIEVVSHHIYIDAPGLSADQLPALTDYLLKIEGVQRVKLIELLPGERRRLHLDALLSTLPDPVFAVDAKGKVLSANSAATAPLGSNESHLIGRPIKTLLDGYSGDLPGRYPSEVTLAGKPYLLDLQPIYRSQSDTTAIGSMLLLHAPPRLGSCVSTVQMGEGGGFESILGESPAIAQARKRALRFANIQAPLLIQGETGTGKELFARAVHHSGHRAHAAFLALNCAALPENLVESELFGYAAGAFSGAVRGGKPGLFELADGGTVFLDEIGEMSLYVQAKLLRFLQDGSFRRVGGKEERQVDVRIICATHRDLEQLVSAKLFREDLMYRLTVLTLALPPLQRYREDIPLLAVDFVRRAATQIGCPAPALSREALDMLTGHPWPGNVRQLQNHLFRTVALCQGEIIGAQELLEAETTSPLPRTDAVKNSKCDPTHRAFRRDTETGDSTAEPESWEAAKAEFEKSLLSRLYKHYPSTRRLAKRLKVSHTMIADKLRAYGIKG
ncbi:MAG: sigma 54-interacting transcriptional regulator [Exilibacterium sp.]